MKKIKDEKIYAKIIFGDLSFHSVKCYKVIISSDEDYSNTDLYNKKEWIKMEDVIIYVKKGYQEEIKKLVINGEEQTMFQIVEV